MWWLKILLYLSLFPMKLHHKRPDEALELYVRFLIMRTRFLNEDGYLELMIDRVIFLTPSTGRDHLSI